MGCPGLRKVIIVLGAGLSGAISMSSLSIKEKYHGAYAALLLAATLGMMVLVSSKELISLYVGLETSSVSLYGLAAISKKDDLSLEAGIKYLVIGALSSGLLLYGLSLAYLSTGTTSLDAMRGGCTRPWPHPLLVVGRLRPPGRGLQAVDGAAARLDARRVPWRCRRRCPLSFPSHRNPRGLFSPCACSHSLSRT